jgi:hypothetical protein
VLLPTSHHQSLYLYRQLCKDTVAMLKSAVRCAHCGAYSPKLRHDSHNKLFQVPLSKKLQRLNDAESITTTSALVLVPQQQQLQQQQHEDTSVQPKNNDRDATGHEKADDDYDSDDTDRNEDNEATEGVENTADNNDDDDDDDVSQSATISKRDK